MPIWYTDNERNKHGEQDTTRTNKETIEHKQLKQKYKEYQDNKRQITVLIRDKQILTQEGQKQYQHIKDRQKQLKQTLTENGVKI